MLKRVSEIDDPSADLCYLLKKITLGTRNVQEKDLV